MLLLAFLLVIGRSWCGTSSACVKNAYIKDFQLLFPLANDKVARAYHPTMGAEIHIDVEQFNLMQHEFSVCAVVEQLHGSETVEIFRECGRSIFGHAVVNATDGWSDLSLVVYHNQTEICSVSATVQCCVDNSILDQIEETNRRKVLSNFLQFGKDMYAAPQANLLEARTQMVSNHGGMRVIVGIKSGALNIAKRAAIRSTWLSDLYTLHTHDTPITFEPYFLVGDSSVARDNAEVLSVLKLEQATYGDVLLAAELPARDSYHTLGQKVLSFLAYVFGARKAKKVYAVIVLDDDVFVDVWELRRYLKQLQANSSFKSFYGGEVLEQRMHKQFFPIRDRQHRNYLPESAYPMSVLPPFALGNFYLLSGDLAGYLARNADTLRITGSLEDLSVGVWMMGLQAFPVHMSGVCDVSRCLFDKNLYVAAPPAAGAPHERLLAVAGLDDPRQFDTLNRVVQYRAAKTRTDSQEELSLMEWTLRNMLKDVVDRKHKKSAAKSTLATSPSSRCCRLVHDYGSYDAVQRVAVFLPNMRESTDSTCLLELIRCEVSAHHLVDIVVNTLHATDSFRALLANSGIAVRYFPELAAENILSTIEHAEQRMRGAAPVEDSSALFSYLDSVDVALVARFEDEASGELSALQGLNALLAQTARSGRLGTSILCQVLSSGRELSLSGFTHDLRLDTRTVAWYKISPLPERVPDLNAFIAALNIVPRVDTASPALLPSLARHTVLLAQVNVVIGSHTVYAIELAESLVTTALPSVLIAWFVMDVRTVFGAVPVVHRITRQREVSPEVITADELQSLRSSRTYLLLSVLDCAEQDTTQPEPHKQFQWTLYSQALLERSAETVNTFTTIFLSGEPLDLSSMDTARVGVLLVTTTEPALLPAPSPRTFVHYLPVFSSSFYEGKDEGLVRAGALLSSFATRDNQCAAAEDLREELHCRAEEKSRGVAYLYHRCDRPQRESFFDAVRLKSVVGSISLTVEALGRCAGNFPRSFTKRGTGTMASRGAPNYIDLAIESYKPFKFVIAFENSFIDGYITEKLTNAYLAGAIPVYLGAPDVGRYFNPLSMINCADYVSLEACADRVILVHGNNTLYREMRSTAPMPNFTMWSTFFPFEREAAHTPASEMFVLQLRKKLNYQA